MDQQAIVQDFEAAWRGAVPRLENFLPVAGEERRRLLLQLVPVDLDMRLSQGQQARIEEYLERFPELSQEAETVVALLQAEYQVRSKRESELNLDEYRRRFPEYHRLLARRLGEPCDIDSEASTQQGWRTHFPAAPDRQAPLVVADAKTLFEQLDKTPLLDNARREELGRLKQRFPTPRALIENLVERNWLTAYQGDTLLEGRGLELCLGPYLLLEPLGQGGMGLVFKARNLLDGQVVAIKRVPGKSLKDRQTVRRFQREIKALSRLAHPHIVRALEAGEVDDTHYLVMEYIEGIDLRNMVKRFGPLPSRDASDYMAQAARGLEHAQAHGLVHRDIKPSNLILKRSENLVKILDLGLARWQGERAADESSTLTLEDALVGTPDYMAPEQTMDAREVDIRTDLYSLGCTLYYLLTGQVPFPGGSVTEKLLKHQTSEPAPVRELRREVPRSLEEVIRTLMAKNPAQRYQTPAEVAGVLLLHAR